MPPLRPAPVELSEWTLTGQKRLARIARAAASATRQTRVVLAVARLCPPCCIGQSGFWVSKATGDRVFHCQRFERARGIVVWRPSTRLCLIGPLTLAMLRCSPCRPDAPLGIHLDAWEEWGWIDSIERSWINAQALEVPSFVLAQRAQLGNLGLYWPRMVPISRSISQAKPVFIEKGP